MQLSNLNSLLQFSHKYYILLINKYLRISSANVITYRSSNNIVIYMNQHVYLLFINRLRYIDCYFHYVRHLIFDLQLIICQTNVDTKRCKLSLYI